MVTDETGKDIDGATVAKGSNVAAITNKHGSFKINNVKGNGTQKEFTIQYANNVDLSGLTIAGVTGEDVIRKNVKDN